MPISKIPKGTQDLFNNISDAGTEGTKVLLLRISTTAAQKLGKNAGQFRFNTSTIDNLLKVKIVQVHFQL